MGDVAVHEVDAGLQELGLALGEEAEARPERLPRPVPAAQLGGGAAAAVQLGHAAGRALAEHAHGAQQRLVVGVPHGEEAVAVHQPRLVVHEDEPAVGGAEQVAGGAAHHPRVPLQAEEVADQAVEVGRQVVEEDQIAPLHQLHQLRRRQPDQLPCRQRLQPPADARLGAPGRGSHHGGEIVHPAGQADHGALGPVRAAQLLAHWLPLPPAGFHQGEGHGRQPLLHAQHPGQVIRERLALDLLRVDAVADAGAAPVRQPRQPVGAAPAAAPLQRGHAGCAGGRQPRRRLLRREARRHLLLYLTTPEDAPLHRRGGVGRRLRVGHSEPLLTVPLLPVRRRRRHRQQRPKSFLPAAAGLAPHRRGAPPAPSPRGLPGGRPRLGQRRRLPPQ